MAYYDPNQEDQTDPNAQQQPQTGPQSGVVSGQGAQSTQQASSPSTPNAPDKPGNFVGIQQYLEQNKPQSAKLASTVGDYVSGQGAQAQSALDQGKAQFEQDVDKNTVGLDQDLFNQAKSNPQDVVADQNKKSQFQKMRDATYSGPSSLETDTDVYQPINIAIQNALGTANKTQTATGRSELLADIQKQRNERVSRGAANLDAALLSASPDSRTILGQARDQITPLQDQMKAVTEAENMKAQQAADQTAKTQQAIRDAFSGPQGVQGQLEADLQNRAAAAKSQSGALADSALARLKNSDPNITEDELKILGINRNQYNGLLSDQKYYNEHSQPSTLNDLTSFATRLQPDAQITPQNIATPEDYARYAALNELMGTSNGFLNDPSQAGKAATDALDFNYSATPNAVADRINNLSVPNGNLQNPGTQTFAQVNKDYNLDQKPANAAHIAVSLASDNTQSSQIQYPSMLSGLQDTLQKINAAYGTNLTVPNDYLSRATKAVMDNLQSVYNNWGPSKQMPNDQQINMAAQIAAYTTFLNDLPKNTSAMASIRNGGGINVPPPTPYVPPGGFTL